MNDLWQWIIENWQIVEANKLLFTTFGVIDTVFIAGGMKVIYDNFLYRDLPEKRKLQNSIDELTEKNNALKEQNNALKREVRDLSTNIRLLNPLQVEPKEDNIGKKISKALHK